MTNEEDAAVIRFVEGFLLKQKAHRCAVDGVGGMVCQPRSGLSAVAWRRVVNRLQSGEQLSKIVMRTQGFIELMGALPPQPAAKVSTSSAVRADDANEILSFIEKFLERQKNGMQIDGLAGAVLGRRVDASARPEWLRIREALLAGQQIGRIVCNNGVVRLAAQASVTLPGAATPQRSLNDAIAVVESFIAQRPQGATIKLNDIGANLVGINSRFHIERREWLLIRKTLQSGQPAGRLSLTGNTVRLLDGSSSSSSSSSSFAAAAAVSSGAALAAIPAVSIAPVAKHTMNGSVMPVAPVVPKPALIDMRVQAHPAAAALLTDVAAPAAPAAAISSSLAVMHWTVVRSLADCEVAYDALMRERRAVAIDCEGDLGEDDNAPLFLRLVQVATSHHIFIFDMQQPLDAPTCIAKCLCLSDLMQSTSVVKVFHDCRRDVPAICATIHLEQSRVSLLFDTQLAFEYLCDVGAIGERPHKGPRASLNDVLGAFHLPINAAKKQFQTVFDQDPTFWHRPTLPTDALEYAADDVRYLARARDAILSSLDVNALQRWSLCYSDWYARVLREEKAQRSSVPLGVTLYMRFADDDSGGVGSKCRLVYDRLADDETPPQAHDIGVPPPSESERAAFVREFLELTGALPLSVQDSLADTDPSDLVEVVIDADVAPSIRKRDGTTHRFQSTDAVSQVDLVDLIEREWAARSITVGPDQRAPLPATLHRLSVKRDRLGRVDGLTARVGRHCSGAADALRDIISRVAHDKASVLLVGVPGSGKTTLLRECASLLASEQFGSRRVHVVDTSCEIAGDGAVPHPAIGLARRSAVPLGSSQAAVMREVVQNHTPDVIVIDEISDREQARVAQSIRQRGVGLVATRAWRLAARAAPKQRAQLAKTSAALVSHRTCTTDGRKFVRFEMLGGGGRRAASAPHHRAGGSSARLSTDSSSRAAAELRNAFINCARTF
jgi:stage III sporulation protein SpoIIIAA